MEPDTGLTLIEVLAAPEFAGADVVAGDRGLDRRVTGVNIVEVPDVSRWLRGGELLFTSGYAWREDIEKIAGAITELYALGVAGLALKTGSYLPELPATAREVADALPFPVILLPESAPYMDIIDPLIERLNARRLLALEKSHRLEQDLLAPGLDEQSIEGVAGVLAREVGISIYILDMVGSRIVSSSTSGTTRVVGLEDVNAYGDERAALVASEFPPVALPATRRGDRRNLGTAGHGFFVPLVVSHEVRGVLVGFEESGVFDDYTMMMLAHGAELVSFLLLKNLAHIEGRAEATAVLVSSILDDRLSDEDAMERSLAVGLRISRPISVLLIGALDAGGPEERASVREEISRLFRGLPHAIGNDHGRTVVLTQSDCRDDVALNIDPICQELQQALDNRGIHSPIVAVGSSLVGLAGIRQSRTEALIAYGTQAVLGKGGIVRFTSLGVERLLSLIPRSEVSEEYIRRTLGPVAESTELMHTLRVYLDCGARKAAAASKLSLHRSSLEYRLERIVKLLDLDLGRPEHQLELWLAIRLRDIYTAQGP